MYCVADPYTAVVTCTSQLPFSLLVSVLCLVVCLVWPQFGKERYILLEMRLHTTI